MTGLEYSGWQLTDDPKDGRKCEMGDRTVRLSEKNSDYGVV